MVCNVGSKAKLCIHDADPATFPDDTNSKLYEIQSETLTGRQPLIDLSGLSGTRERRAAAVADGPKETGGDVALFLSPIDMEDWAPRIIGDNSNTVANVTTFDFAETLDPFGILIDRLASNGTRSTWEYQDVKIGRTVISSSAQSQPVLMTCTVLGTTETFHGAVFPASITLPTGASAKPYVHSQGVFTYQSKSYKYNAFELVIDNGLDARLENALTAEEICATDQIVTLRLNVPWTDTFAPDFAAAAGAGNIQWTAGGLSTQILFGSLHQLKQAPNATDKNPIRWNLELEARLSADGNTPQIQIVNDLAP